MTFPALALRATVQILLQQNSGIWVNTSSLCFATGCPADRVRNVLHQLVDAGTAHMSTVDGTEYFGIGVEGVPPRFQSHPNQGATA